MTTKQYCSTLNRALVNEHVLYFSVQQVIGCEARLLLTTSTTVVVLTGRFHPPKKRLMIRTVYVVDL